MQIDTDDAFNQFCDALRLMGFEINNSDVIADGKLHRWRVSGDKSSQLSGAYVLHLDGYPAGFIQNFKNADNGIKWKYQAKREHNYTHKPVSHIDNQAKIAQKAQELELAQLQTAAILEQEYINAKLANSTHPYLLKKQITPSEDIKLDKYGNLLIPLRDENGKLFSLQRITASGDKFIGAIRSKEQKEQGISLPARKKGCFYTNKPLNEHSEFLLCEGYATARSLELVLNKPVIMAVDALNLGNVATLLNEKYPTKQITIYADNDIAKPNNTGLDAAVAIKQKLPSVKIIAPALTRDDIDEKLSDFNDIACKYGSNKLLSKMRAVSVFDSIATNDKGGDCLISISNGIKELNNLKNKIKDGAEILYQSPNANSNLQTLLQASRYSANEIDKANTTKNHFKSQYAAHSTSPQTPNKDKDLER